MIAHHSNLDAFSKWNGRYYLAVLASPFAFRCTFTEKKTFEDLDDEQVYFQT